MIINNASNRCVCSSGTRSPVPGVSTSLDITKTLVLMDWWPTTRPTVSHGTSLNPPLFFLFLRTQLWKTERINIWIDYRAATFRQQHHGGFRLASWVHLFFFLCIFCCFFPLPLLKWRPFKESCIISNQDYSLVWWVLVSFFRVVCFICAFSFFFSFEPACKYIIFF